MTKTFQFTTRVWLYEGTAAWHFVTLPKEIAEEIDYYFVFVKRGWGSLPVFAKIGDTEWKTSIFPDKKAGSYLLPLKAEVRKKEQIGSNSEIMVSLKIER